MAQKESLTVELDANTAKLDASLKSTDGKLDKLTRTTKKADSGLVKFEKSVKTVDIGLVSIAASATAAAAAITAIAVASADGDRELGNLSKTAKTTKENFKALSFAFSTVGVDTKGVADAFNDVSERIGEFAATFEKDGKGSGAFQDFADVMKLTDQEAGNFAQTLENMSAEDALAVMVKQMQDADVSGTRMSFVLKSLSNDLEYANQLFADNGKELNRLKGAYSEMSKELQLTTGQSKQLAGLAESFGLLKTGLGDATSVISSSLAPALTGFFNSVIEVVPNATNTIVDFINTFNQAADIQSIREVEAQMESLADVIENGLAKGYGEMSRNMQENPLDFVRVGEYKDAVERLNELEQQRALILEEQAAKELELAEIRAGGVIAAGEGAEGEGAEGEGEDANSKELEALMDRFKTEEELLTQKFEKELEIAKGNKELLLQLENEYIESLMELDESEAERNQEKFDSEIAMQQELLSQKLINEEGYLKNVNKIGVKYGKVDEKDTKEKNKKKEMSDGDYASAAIGAADALFGNNKAVKAAGVVVDTASGISKAFSDLPYPAAIGASIQIAATGVAQLAAITSASKGGGSAPSAPASAAAPVPVDSSVTGEVEISETVTQGGNTVSTTGVLTITADDSDELATAFANVMNKKIQSGELELG